MPISYQNIKTELKIFFRLGSPALESSYIFLQIFLKLSHFVMTSQVIMTTNCLLSMIFLLILPNFLALANLYTLIIISQIPKIYLHLFEVSNIYTKNPNQIFQLIKVQQKKIPARFRLKILGENFL